LHALKAANLHKQCILIFTGELQHHITHYLEQHKFQYHNFPFMERTEVLKYFLLCDYVVIPSTYEGMPNVMLEAGGLGIPVIASAIAGMKDVITDGQDGFLFTPLSMDSATNTLNTALKLNAEQRLAMGDKLRQKIQAHYHCAAEVNHYLSAFAQDGYLLEQAPST